MLFQDLVIQIATEGRISGDADFQPLVIGLINELFKEAVESQRPMELRCETLLDLTSGVEFVELPDNFFIHHQVRFIDIDTQKVYSLTDQDKAASPAPRGLYGHPKTFEIQSGQIILKPPLAIVTGDKLHLVYYKIPPVLTPALLQTQNPLIRLEPFLIRGCVRRIRMLHGDDLQVAQILGGDVSSAATAYSKDEPIRNSRPDKG